MLSVGDKLVTRKHWQMEEDGVNSLQMIEDREVDILYIDGYVLETEDGEFTVDPDSDGHSWKNFYNVKGD